MGELRVHKQIETPYGGKLIAKAKATNLVLYGGINVLVRDLTQADEVLYNENMFTEYDPERFSGLIIKVPLPDKPKKVSILLFRNGRIVVSGSDNLEDIEKALEVLLQAMLKYPDVFIIQDVKD